MKSIYFKIILVVSVVMNIGLFFYASKFLDSSEVKEIIVEINANEEFAIPIGDRLYNSNKELLIADRVQDDEAFYKIDKGFYYHIFIDSYSYKMRLSRYEAK